MSPTTPVSLRRRSGTGDAELSLLPFMNLMTLLIPFLLVSAHFVSLAVIDSSLPGIVVGEASTEDPLLLTVGITDDGFLLRGNAEGLAKDPIPRLQGDWDYAALTEALEVIKTDHPADEAVILAPEDEIAYDVVVRTMDAARASADRLLFPSVTFAGGVR